MLKQWLSVGRNIGNEGQGGTSEAKNSGPLLGVDTTDTIHDMLLAGPILEMGEIVEVVDIFTK